MGRAEGLSRTLLESAEGAGWKSPFTHEGKRAVDSPLPPSVRRWAARSREQVTNIGPYQHRTRSDKARSGLAQRVAVLETELSQLKERLQQAETAPLIQLVEAGRITEARQLVSLLLKASPSPRLEQWARVLAPPEASVAPAATGGTLARDNAWLRANAKDYAGRWVALRDGVLVDADASRVALHRRLEQTGELEGIAFARL
jgi:hypothetical protein